MWTALGYTAVSTTTQPAMIQSRPRSGLWHMTRAPRYGGTGDVMKHATGRMTAGFLFIGPAMKLIEAKALLG